MLGKLLIRYLRPYGWLLLGVLVFQLIAALASLYLPSLNADIIDEGVSKGDTEFIWSTGAFMAALRQGRTSFVIAHRLSTIRDADLILVMEHGDIVEQGNHEQLIARQGAYWRLYNSQFEQAATDLDAELAAEQANKSPAQTTRPLEDIIEEKVDAVAAEGDL